jgi:predicted metallo-beta-lactamase superfamily hydrolase
MRVELLGFDSMGTRGMAVFLEVNGTTIFIDPGANLAPRRHGLPPHRLELEALDRTLGRIHELMGEAEHVVISHYHRDHFLYRRGEEDYYNGKNVYAKDYTRDINFSQRSRAYNLFVTRGVSEMVRKLEFADNRSFKINEDLSIEFSPPLPHGPEGTRLGFILYTVVKTSELTLVHASDAQGPISRRGVDFIKNVRPSILIISGPPTYLSQSEVEENSIEEGIRNLAEIAKSMPDSSTIIVDHHLLRDLNYKQVLRVVEEAASSSGRRVRVVTAAEYMNQPVNQLEARRRELWGSRL